MQDKPFPTGKLALGLLLLVAGGLMFLDEIDLIHVGPIWSYWPVFLIVVGVVSEYDAIRYGRGDGGFILIAVGVWMLCATQRIFGLNYRTGFPIGVVIAGAGMTLHAILRSTRSELKENGNHE
ncbi:MAG TPA: DUF5668 domain-containing protein [Thermoanaerobaculia bacterium]|nr:DUF5668 domain-containing protein [Thermoanaerobaculia bacterium]